MKSELIQLCCALVRFLRHHDSFANLLQEVPAFNLDFTKAILGFEEGEAPSEVEPYASVWAGVEAGMCGLCGHFAVFAPLHKHQTPEPKVAAIYHGPTTFVQGPAGSEIYCSFCYEYEGYNHQKCRFCNACREE